MKILSKKWFPFFFLMTLSTLSFSLSPLNTHAETEFTKFLPSQISAGRNYTFTALPLNVSSRRQNFQGYVLTSAWRYSEYNFFLDWSFSDAKKNQEGNYSISTTQHIISAWLKWLDNEKENANASFRTSFGMGLGLEKYFTDTTLGSSKTQSSSLWNFVPYFSAAINYHWPSSYFVLCEIRIGILSLNIQNSNFTGSLIGQVGYLF